MDTKSLLDVGSGRLLHDIQRTARYLSRLGDLPYQFCLNFTAYTFRVTEDDALFSLTPKAAAEYMLAPNRPFPFLYLNTAVSYHAAGEDLSPLLEQLGCKQAWEAVRSEAWQVGTGGSGAGSGAGVAVMSSREWSPGVFSALLSPDLSSGLLPGLLSELQSNTSDNEYVGPGREDLSCTMLEYYGDHNGCETPVLSAVLGPAEWPKGVVNDGWLTSVEPPRVHNAYLQPLAIGRHPVETYLVQVNEKLWSTAGGAQHLGTGKSTSDLAWLAWLAYKGVESLKGVSLDDSWSNVNLSMCGRLPYSTPALTSGHQKGLQEGVGGGSSQINLQRTRATWDPAHNAYEAEGSEIKLTLPFGKLDGRLHVGEHNMLRYRPIDEVALAALRSGFELDAFFSAGLLPDGELGGGADGGSLPDIDPDVAYMGDGKQWELSALALNLRFITESVALQCEVAGITPRPSLWVNEDFAVRMLPVAT